MASTIRNAKMAQVSWNALEKVDPFTAAVKKCLKGIHARRKAKVFPKDPLPEDKLDKVIMCIWCACYCGMQWRSVSQLAGLPFTTVYSCFLRWTRLGLWQELLAGLLRDWRTLCGDDTKPTTVVIDSRSCRSSPTCGRRGIDGGKKIKGIKINLVVEKHGIPLAVHITAAHVHDTVGILPALQKVSSHGFRGKALGDLSYQGPKLREAAEALGIAVETKASGTKGSFIPTGLRWIVERSFAWLSRYRRLNTIFDRTDESLIAFVQIAFISILSCRLRRIEMAENCA
jgi:transposase